MVKNYWAGVQNLQNQLFSLVTPARWKRPSALPEDGAPSARLVAPKGPGRACAPRSAASAAWRLAAALTARLGPPQS